MPDPRCKSISGLTGNARTQSEPASGLAQVRYTSGQGGTTQGYAMKCLWLARAMPFPLSAGDRIYSFKLAASFAEAGANIVFVGLSASITPDPVAGITWHVIPGKERHQVLSLFNTLPLVAARHATRQYRKGAAELLSSRRWDTIVIDHYGS